MYYVATVKSRAPTSIDVGYLPAPPFFKYTMVYII